MKSCRCLMSAQVLILLILSVPEAHTQVLAQWRFEGNDWRTATTGAVTWSGGTGVTGMSGGVQGQYLQIGPTQGGLISARIGSDEAQTLAFWFRFAEGGYSPKVRWLHYSDYSVFTQLQPDKIYLLSKVMTDGGQVVDDDLVIPLKGTGKSSFGYYTDGQWHHIVFKLDPGTGRREVWVDGECPPGFSRTSEVRGKLCATAGCKPKSLFFSGNPSAGAAYIGDLDEVILYQGWAAASVHQDWYRQGKTPASTRAIPAQLPAADLIAGMDKREFAPGHPQVSLTPVEQLRRFPLPRYQPGHQLPRLYNWMALDFMGGLTQPGITRDMARRNSVAVQEELITHWHYMLILHNVGTFHGDRYLRDTTTFQQAWIEQANRHPEVPLAVTTFWAQTPLTLLGEKERTPYVLRSTMPDNYYLRSTQGKYLNTRGEPTDKALLVSPAAPEELFRKDGESVKICFEDLLEVLTRPIDMINENGEVRPIPLDSAVAVKDSRVATHYKASGIRDWKTYETRQRNRLYEAYKAPFMSLPGLKGTTFTLYGTDGGPLDRYTWTEARKVQTPIRGQYYATPDFYPRWPDNWRMWKGPWRGWEWLDISRKVEMAAGDTFFSPFIAAGWSRTEADNVRPSQWLGLVKHLGVIGAPFYYTGFFNEGRAGDTYADPKNYVWQAAIPAYAQAITSRYESLLWKGDVLRDAQGKPIITWETGDPRILVTVRKDASAPRYIICGNINPNTNIAGNVPDTAPTRIILGQDTIRFEVRRQGSVYLLDLSQPQAPVFYQVDTWHEAGHPIWWSENFQVEAEVWDAARGATRHTQRPAGVRPGDFRQWTTYVHLDPAGGQVSTTLAPRKPVTHAQWTGTLRGTGRKKTALEILVNGTTVGKISKIKHTDWKTVTLSLSGLSLTANTPFEVTLRASGGAVEVDNWVLKPQ